MNQPDDRNEIKEIQLQYREALYFVEDYDDDNNDKFAWNSHNSSNAIRNEDYYDFLILNKYGPNNNPTNNAHNILSASSLEHSDQLEATDGSIDGMQSLSSELDARKEAANMIFMYDDSAHTKNMSEENTKSHDNYDDDVEHSSLIFNRDSHFMHYHSTNGCQQNTSTVNHTDPVHTPDDSDQNNHHQSGLVHSQTIHPPDSALSSTCIHQRPGAFSAQGGQARAQRKGYLTRLDENNRIPTSSLLPSTSTSKTFISMESTHRDINNITQSTDIKNNEKKDREQHRPVQHRRCMYLSIGIFVSVMVGVAAITISIVYKQLSTKSSIQGDDNEKSSNERLFSEISTYCLEKYHSNSASFESLISDNTALLMQIRHFNTTLLQHNINPETDSTMLMTCSPQNLAILYIIIMTNGLSLMDEDVVWSLDWYALLVFYFSTNGNKWRNTGHKWSLKTNDSTILHPCQSMWYGLVCSDDLRVVEISLGSNSLRGTIPEELFLLTDLKLINLSMNKNLKGTVPSEIGRMKSTKVFDVWATSLLASLPVEMDELSSLEHLDIGNTNIILPSNDPCMGILKLRKLTHLGLENIGMRGSISTEITNLSNLEIIKWNGNVLSASLPTQFFQLTNLKLLNVDQNSLSGSLPSEIGLLTKLTELNLSRNMLTGTLPIEIFGLSNLEIFHAHSNILTGSLPSAIGNLTKLASSALQMNGFEGSIPSEIGLLTAFANLNLSFNKFTGRLPSELSNLSNLIFFFCWAIFSHWKFRWPLQCHEKIWENCDIKCGFDKN